MSDLKIKALELANQHGSSTEPAQTVVDRAKSYHAFLSGGAAPAATTAAGKPAATQAATAPAKPATQAAKPAAATTTKPAATAAKPAATQAVKPAPAKPATAASADQKSPDGKHTFNQVVEAARALIATPGGSKDLVSKLMAENGNGAANSKQLKPEFYGAVIEALQAEIADMGGAKTAVDTSDIDMEPAGAPAETDEMAV